MFQVNDIVVYGVFGICKICAVEKHRFSGESREYYVLRSVYDDKNTFYIPVQNEEVVKKLRRLCTKEEIDCVLSHINDERPAWIENESQRREAFHEIIRRGNKCEIIVLIRMLLQHRRKVVSAKKKPHSSDEDLLHTAEKMLYEEFAYVLGVKKEDVAAYIKKRIL